MGHTAKKTEAQKKRAARISELIAVFFVVLGGVLQGIGLEVFLIPNGFLDGGVVGIAIILTNYISLPLGVFLAVLNAPFVLMAAKFLGKRVAAKTVIGIVSLVLTTLAMHEVHYVVNHWSLALGYGGVLLGLGTGLALRNGGALDGSEALAAVISYNSRWSVDQMILAINVLIFVTAGFVMTPESALASGLLFYAVVAPMIKRVVDGDNELKMAQIITDMPQEVIDAIHTQNERRIVSHRSRIKTEDGSLGETYTLTLIVSRMEESTITQIVRETDEDAIVAYVDVSNISGGVYESTSAH